MKGSILIKLGNYFLAEKSWKKALNLEPNNKILINGLNKLNNKISKNNSPKDLSNSSNLPIK